MDATRIVVLTPSELSDLLRQTAADAVRIALAEQSAAAPGQDRFVNAAEAARLLGINPNTFSAAQMWRHIPHSILLGGERRYRVSDILKYKGPAALQDITPTAAVDGIAPSKSTLHASAAAPTPKPGRKSKIISLDCPL